MRRSEAVAEVVGSQRAPGAARDEARSRREPGWDEPAHALGVLGSAIARNPHSTGRLNAHYVLPLRWADDAELEDLTAYLEQLARLVPVTVVDGSPAPLFDAHHARWEGLVAHVPPEPWPGRNGKVAGVMTGVRHAGSERVVIADDDVRYGEAELRRAVALLDDADLVRPQNYFSELPWHARWDTARSLLNRAFGSDYPGTFALRRSTLLDAGGYDGDVLFENLELMRTVSGAGGRIVRADDLYIARRPPAARHFLGQRVRQAYDSLAQPGRLAVELALLPTLLAAVRRPRLAAGLVGAVVLLAERGRRRLGGASVFPAATVLFAPAWVVERAVCIWLAVGRRLTGGMPYAGSKIVWAATPQRRRGSRRRC
jgi:hypothetical protein